MIKKLLTAAGLAALAAVGFAGNALAEEYQRVNLYVDGKEIVSDQPAVIYNSRTVIPVRAVLETFNCSVDWDNETKTVIISQDGINLYMTVGSNTIIAKFNEESETITIDTPPVVLNGRTMIPLAFFGDIMGFDVSWDGNTKTVYVSSETEISQAPVSGNTEIMQNIIAVNDRITDYMDLLVEKIDSMTTEQLNEFSTLCDDIEVIDLINGADEETLKKLESLENRFIDFMAKCGINATDAKTGTSPASKPEVPKAEPAKPVNEKLTVFYEDNYDSYTDYVVSEAMTVQILETNKLLLEGLSGYMEQMSENNLEIFADLSKTSGEDTAKITDNLEESTAIILSLNTTNCDLAAMAEGLGIDLGENMKEYTVSIDKPVYYSSNETEVLAAKVEALKTHNRYNDIIDDYYKDFTDKQFDEYNRITCSDTYFMFQYSDKENIEYYRGSLKLLDKMNARTEIFAKKYGISLS